jgi:hypothetical protein
MQILGFSIQRTSPPPADPLPNLSGFLVGEIKRDRIERVYADSVELVRRAYAGLEWSRRAMQAEKIGQRRWQSAYAFLLCANVIYRDSGALVHESQVMARRCLTYCRDHHLFALKNGRYSPPF